MTAAEEKSNFKLALRASYRVSIVRICEEIDRVITASHCMLKNYTIRKRQDRLYGKWKYNNVF